MLPQNPEYIECPECKGDGGWILPSYIGGDYEYADCETCQGTGIIIKPEYMAQLKEKL